MVGEAVDAIHLKDDFYRDGFHKLLLIWCTLISAIGLIIAISVYLWFAKPHPVNFQTYDEWRLLPDIPVTQPYLPTAKLLQWVSSALSSVFTYDFLNYNDQLNSYAPYFTANGWKVFLGIVNQYAALKTITSGHLFLVGSANGAPGIVNQGLLNNNYAWWVQMPININYSGYGKSYIQALDLQVLVVRVPTLNNLDGVAIDNIVLSTNTNASRRPG